MKEALYEKVVEVRRVLTVVLVLEEDVLRLTCGHAPQCCRCLDVVDVTVFYDELNGKWHMHSADNLVMCLAVFNGHVGGYIGKFDWVHGAYGVGQRNLQGRMFLMFCLDEVLCVSNTWFKREEKRKVTFRMGENETDTDLEFKRKNTDGAYEIGRQSVVSFKMR